MFVKSSTKTLFSSVTKTQLTHSLVLSIRLSYKYNSNKGSARELGWGVAQESLWGQHQLRYLAVWDRDREVATSDNQAGLPGNG